MGHKPPTIWRKFTPMVILPSDLPLSTSTFCAVLSSSVYSLMRGGLRSKQACTVTVIHYCTDDPQSHAAAVMDR